MYKTSDPARYELWRETHKCSVDHAGSSPAMEECVKQILSIIISDGKLRCTEYYDGGDSKGFFFFSLCIFSQVPNIRPREDNPNLYYWAEMTGLFTHKHLTYNRYQSH